MGIPREAGRITYSTDIRNRKRISLTEHQKTIVVGAVLGDAGLYGNWSNTNYRLQVRQCLKQSAYVEWTYQALAPLVLTPPQYYERTRSMWFRTISHPELTQLHMVFYRDGKKIIPENISEYIQNPMTIAVWFMDDGNVIKHKNVVRGYHLNTQSFTQEENERLATWFESVYRIRCSIEQNHGKPRLAIWQRASREAFATLVEEYLLPSMKYKLGCIGDPP